MAETIGYGSKLQIKDNSTWKTIPQVSSLTPPTQEPNKVTVEELDGDGWVKSLPGLNTEAEASVTLNFDPELEEHIAFKTFADSKEMNDYRILLPGGEHAIEFTASNSFEPGDIGAEEVVQVTITFYLYKGFELVEVVDG